MKSNKKIRISIDHQQHKSRAGRSFRLRVFINGQCVKALYYSSYSQARQMKEHLFDIMGEVIL